MAIVVKKKWDFGFEADAAQGEQEPVEILDPLAINPLHQDSKSVAGGLMRQRRSKSRFSDLVRAGMEAGTAPKPHARKDDNPGHPWAHCPKCGHPWSRHVERHRAVFQCMVREIDASGNFDGCGCGELPPRLFRVS